jgi:DNA-binding Xre family transcriptional regulator
MWSCPAFTQLAKNIQREMTLMITYSRLWLVLHRRGYSPRDIIHLARISESTYRKMSRNEPVRMDVLERVCAALRVDVGDVCSFSTLPTRIR